MKLQKVKIIPKRKKRVVKEIIAICDIFDKTAKRVCVLCGRDICEKHCKWDPWDYGDYPDKYCEKCYDLKFNKYKDEYLQIEDEYEKKHEALINKIREESMK